MFQYYRKIQIKQSAILKYLRNNYSVYTYPVPRSLNNIEQRKLFQDNLKLYCNYKLCNFSNIKIYSNHERQTRTLYNNFLLKKPLFVSQQCFIKHDTNNVLLSQNDANDLEYISSRFKQPKNVLHNYYNVIATEVLSDSYKVEPQYKMNISRKNDSNLVKAINLLKQWTCIYNIKWPQELEFQCTAATKREASHRAACKVLSYLMKSGKISEKGAPLIYDKAAVKKITKQSHFSLILSDFVTEQLQDICDIFNKNILPNINLQEIGNNNLFELNNNHFVAPEYIVNKRSLNENISHKQLNMYKAKETVDLPVQNHREELENLLDNNQVIIVRGEPGCGKSTRIPQYVLEHFVNTTQSTNARIIVTQPRRVAAISLAERVAQERNEKVGNVVGYQVRLNTMFNQQTGRILYCTTGILLRQIQADPSLSHCTHIILDEAHERDVNTDLLMNLIRQALDRNPNLKLIIMSATIDISLFQKYFNDPPLMQIPGFTYPVKAHFLEDIKLDLSRTAEAWNRYDSTNLIHEDVAKVITWIDKTKPEGAILCFLPGWEDIIKIKHLLFQSLNPSTTSIVTIHSKLSYDDQKKIFKKPPPGIRKIILATNIAETSVTVNDVVYVVDAGVQKETRFNTEKGLMCIDNHRISKSSMNQRKGRAGRVQPGESFHIYPEISYKEMLPFSLPEILRMSLTKIVLDAKVYSQNMNTEEFFSHLPTPPKVESVEKAVEELQDLEMLDENENLTLLGRVVSDFQLPPKLSKAMINSVIYKCVIPIVDIATLFSFDSNMFANILTEKYEINKAKSELMKDSDHIALMILFEQWAKMVENMEFREAIRYCTKYNLVPQKLNTLKKLKDIHYEYLDKYLKNALELSDEFSNNQEIIKGVLLSGVGTFLFKRNWDMVKGRLKKKNVFITGGNQKATITSDSLNFKNEKYESPILIYINETHSEMRRTTVIRETSVIQPLTFILFKNSKLTFTEIFHNDDVNISNPVLIHLEGTKFKMICNKKQALLIESCKHALKVMENYFVYQLTKGEEKNENILHNWDLILYKLNDILKLKKNL